MVVHVEPGAWVPMDLLGGSPFPDVSWLDASQRSAYAASKIVLVVSISLLCSNPPSFTAALYEGTS
jgi:hypothetical protein